MAALERRTIPAAVIVVAAAAVSAVIVVSARGDEHGGNDRFVYGRNVAVSV